MHLSSPDPAIEKNSLVLMKLCWLFPQFHSKMENAEVLEMTVKKVEDILKNRTQGLHNSVTLYFYHRKYDGTPPL